MITNHIDALIDSYLLLKMWNEQEKNNYTKLQQLQMIKTINDYWQDLLVEFKSEEAVKEAIIVWKLQN